MRLRKVIRTKTGHDSKVYPILQKKNLACPQRHKTVEKNLEVLEGKIKFLKGAEIAYETILTSFAAGDLIKLKAFLSKYICDFQKQ